MMNPILPLAWCFFIFLFASSSETLAETTLNSSEHHDVSVNVTCGPGTCQTDFDLKPGYTNVHVTCYGQDPLSTVAKMDCGSSNMLVTCAPPVGTMEAVKECDCQFPGPGKAKAHVNMNGCNP